MCDSTSFVCLDPRRAEEVLATLNAHIDDFNESELKAWSFFREAYDDFLEKEEYLRNKLNGE